MTKRSPASISHTEQLACAGIVPERGPDESNWLMMRDWMARVEDRFDRFDGRFDRSDDRFSQVDRQISALTASVKELTATVGSIDRRLCSVEGKVDDLVAWKHRAWGVVIALGTLSGALTFIGSLLMRHVVG